jgi:hypothetical protein
LRRFVLAVAFFFAVTSTALAENVLVIVDLQMQTMHVRVDGVTKHRWDVSSGAYGFETPPGRYQPTRMYKTYHSRQYDMAPMPYSIFFHQGYAIHGTSFVDRLGRVASHGCVRLATENAATLFALVKKAGPDNTIIRVEANRVTNAVLTDPPAIDQPVVLEAEADGMVDAVTTSSIPGGSIPWLRRGLDS